jgi:hypothetical protein
LILKNLFLNAGAMKAGTTWLYSILKNHPDLYFTYEKEIHFWSDYTLGSNALSHENRIRKTKQILGTTNPKENINSYKRKVDWYSNYLAKDLSLKWYADLFPMNREKQYNCDFSNLTCHMDAKGWELVHHVAANVKVIYILRDPIARLWSHIKFHHQFIGEETDFSAWSKDQFLEFINKPYMWENCEYAKKIEVMRNSLAESSFKIFFFEDLVGNPETYLRKLEDFLGIDNMDYSAFNLGKVVNQSKKITMPAVFKEAAKEKLSDEIQKLRDIGVQPHQSWTLT